MAKAKKTAQKKMKAAAKPAKKSAPKKAAKPVAKKKATKSAKPKLAKVIKLPVKKAAKASKPAPAKAVASSGSHLKLVVDNAKTAKNSKKADYSKVLTPLDDRVLVIVEEGERVTAGGLYIPDTSALTGNHRGTVVSVGGGHRNKKGQLRPLELKVGDRVLFGEYTGTDVELENQKFKILRETDILGLVTE